MVLFCKSLLGAPGWYIDFDGHKDFDQVSSTHSSTLEPEVPEIALPTLQIYSTLYCINH